MWFIRFIAAEEVYGSPALLDRPLDRGGNNQVAGFIVKLISLDSQLIDVSDPLADQLIHDGDRLSVQFEPRKLQLARGQKFPRDFPMEGRIPAMR